MKRPTWTELVKDVAVKLAREAERYVGAQDATPCSSCDHPRSAHCGCGTVCLHELDGKRCSCVGFVPRAE